MEEKTKEAIENNEVSSLEETSNTLYKKKNIKKNYFYNLIYQIFMLIVPLVVTPYVSRVLTADGIGKYSFSFSLITYFTILGALGFGNYAQREIAKNQNDKSKQSKSFWEIVICRLLPISVAILINVVLCLNNVYGDYNTLMWIFNINIISIAFDIAFLYQGNEEFGKLVIRNLIIKTISIVLIFVFIKSTDDLLLYTFINSLSVLLSGISMWTICYKFLIKINIKELKPLKHLKGTFILFLPTIATSIYNVLDKTLIGVLIKDTYVETETKLVDNVVVINDVIKKYADLENGFYEQADKLIKMAMTVITSIGTVMIPRNSREFAEGHEDKVIHNITISSQFVLLIGVPLVLGFISISTIMVPWFFGNGYDKCSLLINILSPLILIIGFSNVFGLQYLIPSGQDTKFTIALIIGAIVNLIFNIILIPVLWSVGAAISTIIAEFFVTISMAIMVRKKINFFRILINGWKYYIAGGCMFLVCYFVSKQMYSSIPNTLIIIVTGCFTYFIVLILLRERTIINFLIKLKSKIFK